VISGAKAARPVLDEVLSRPRIGDVLVIWKVDRLGRSLKHLVTLATELMERKIGSIQIHPLAYDLNIGFGNSSGIVGLLQIWATGFSLAVHPGHSSAQIDEYGM
jgi:DNA invertase Pin-like site-specific DNA recombinase